MYDINNTSNGKILTPFQRKLLQNSLQTSLPIPYRQRIEIMLLADEGKSPSTICEILSCSPATVRQWVNMARTGMAHCWQDCPVGRPKVINDDYIQVLQQLLLSSPRDYGYPFTRWTVKWLGEHLAKELSVRLSDRHIKRLLKQLGLSTRKPNHHPQSPIEGHTAKTRIAIQDLNSQGFTPLDVNNVNLVNNSKTYGAKSQRCSLNRTIEPGVRSLLLSRRIFSILPTVSV